MKSMFLLVAAGIVLGGCVVVPRPYLKVTAPEITGRVVDAATHKPVPDVSVCFEGQDAAVVRSGADGCFRMPRRNDLVLTRVYTPCPVYDFPEPRRLPGAIVFEKTGYKRHTIALTPYYSQLPTAKRAGTVWHPETWDDPIVKLGDVEIPLAGAAAPTSAEDDGGTG